MTCPYCSKEMKQGNICVALNIAPHWLDEGEKRRDIGEFFAGKGQLPFKEAFMKGLIPGWRCPECKKIVVDEEIKV